MQRVTYLGKVVAYQDGLYKTYVFKNLDEKDNSFFRYFTVTKLPNWDIPDLKINDVGYVECEYVNAGENYWKTSTGLTEQYNYTACYIINFIKKQQLKDFKI